MPTLSRISVVAEVSAAKRAYDEYGKYRLTLEFNGRGSLLYEQVQLFVPIGNDAGSWESTHRPDLAEALRGHFVETDLFSGLAQKLERP
jgi:hypothetical protein